jgi:hypothetical protein
MLFQELGITESEDDVQLFPQFMRDTAFVTLGSAGSVWSHHVAEGLAHFVEALHPNRKQHHLILFPLIISDAPQNTASQVARVIFSLSAGIRKHMISERKFYEKKSEMLTEEYVEIGNADVAPRHH